MGGRFNCVTAAYASAVGCNLTANVACTFFTNNSCTCGTVTATCFIETSSQRFKCCIQPLSSTGQIINDLNPVRFKWIDQNKGTQDEYGLIAEEVHKVIPEAVKLDQEGQPEGVSYTKLVPILIKAVQELQQRVDELEKNIYTK
ncbi:MAG: tail fiber domain-containing protein [Actinobacteria bacterium]|nr:tail fiber domain-containing protein [Actinomycetota bacterium]